MPLIDRSYFVVELNIPKTDTVPVQENLDTMIQQREPELLKGVLGYALYKSFMAGLALDPVPTIWSNLLLGAEYTDRYGKLQYWRGLVSSPLVLINATNQANRIPVVADAEAVSSQTILVPETLILRPWTLDKRAIGPLREDEFDVSEDGTAVAFTAPVALDDTYWFYSNDLSLEQSTAGVKESLIANYVYFHYLAKEASQTTPTGESSPDMENSSKQGPARKQQRAWNQMIDWLYELVEFLDSSRSLYPDWQLSQKYRVFLNYKHITRF